MVTAMIDLRENTFCVCLRLRGSVAVCACVFVCVDFLSVIRESGVLWPNVFDMFNYLK